MKRVARRYRLSVENGFDWWNQAADRGAHLFPFSCSQFQQRRKLRTLLCAPAGVSAPSGVEYDAALGTDDGGLFAKRQHELVAGIECPSLGCVVLFIGLGKQRETVGEVLKSARRVICNDQASCSMLRARHRNVHCRTVFVPGILGEFVDDKFFAAPGKELAEPSQIYIEPADASPWHGHAVSP